MNIVSIGLWFFNYSSFNKWPVMLKFTQCSPEVSPGGAIFRSILAANIANYGQMPKTLNMTPPELMRNPG
jgi:hypothetical protein